MATEEKPKGFRRLTSRKFLLPVLTTVMLAVTDAVGITLQPETIDTVVTLVLGFMGVETAVDITRTIKTGK